jgi:hypothetical protein
MRKYVLGAVAFSLLVPVTAEAQVAYGLVGSDRIITFDAATPGTITSNFAIVGLEAGAFLTGIDLRPANGQIYTLATSGNLYSLTSGGGVYTANLVGNIAVGNTGSGFGIDFNPTVDRLRFINDTDQNLRINPGTAVTLTDTAIGGGFDIIGSAYTNNFPGASTTILYGIDAATESLVRSTNPNGGVYVTVGSLGLGSFSADSRVGFDVFSGAGTNTAYLALNDAFYTVDLSTGGATLIGSIGASNVRGLTLQLGVPEPATWALMIIGFGAIGASMRSSRRKGASLAAA